MSNGQIVNVLVQNSEGLPPSHLSYRFWTAEQGYYIGKSTTTVGSMNLTITVSDNEGDSTSVYSLMVENDADLPAKMQQAKEQMEKLAELAIMVNAGSTQLARGAELKMAIKGLKTLLAKLADAEQEIGIEGNAIPLNEFVEEAEKIQDPSLSS